MSSNVLIPQVPTMSSYHVLLQITQCSHPKFLPCPPTAEILGRDAFMLVLPYTVLVSYPKILSSILPLFKGQYQPYCPNILSQDPVQL